jgi:undecaprenyl diphosphate synthase
MGFSGLYRMKDFLAWVKPGSLDAELAARVDPSRLPRHIAVIMDGNGRWAKRRFLPRVAGHQAGIDAVRETIESSCRLGIEALTLYAFSVENWKRPRAEVETLWALLDKYLRGELGRLKANNVRFQVIGRVEQLPASVQATLDYAIVETAANSGLRLTVALNYGGRTEIVDAVNALLAQARQSGADIRIDESTFGDYLSTAGLPDPDLLIRTSGEVRVSNFLLWQIAYTEIWVTERYWPDFRTEDLLEAILDFQKRERRFGGLGPAAPQEAPALVAAGGAPRRSAATPLGERSE